MILSKVFIWNTYIFVFFIQKGLPLIVNLKNCKKKIFLSIFCVTFQKNPIFHRFFCSKCVIYNENKYCIMKTKASLYAHFNYLQIKKVYNNSLICSPLIVREILKNVVLRKRSLKFSDGEKNFSLAPRKPLLGTLPSKLFRYGL